MYKKKILSLAVCLVMATLTIEAEAALKKDNSADPKAAYNPREDKGDIELPMPNGMKMVMRAVPIDCGDYYYDKKILLGVKNLDSGDGEKGAEGDEGRAIYEKTYNSYISSSIMYNDLPKSWQNMVGSGDNNYCYYFIEKYELTNGQWDSVMGDGSEKKECSENDKAFCQPNFPKTNISWYDIQAFLQKYNAWLMSQNFDSNHFPVIDGSPMYLRLPTEAEWEYAARGGNMAAEEEISNDFNFPDSDDVKKFAVFNTNTGTPKAIGSLNPNKLFIYDTSGNVEEIIGDGFRFTVPDIINGSVMVRLHGSEGGLVIKGGSYLSSNVSDLKPGRRNEIKMFAGSGKDGYKPFSARYVGTRFVLTSINVQSEKKARHLEQIAKIKDVKVQSADSASEDGKIDESSNRIVVGQGALHEDIARLYKVANTPFMKSNLRVLKDMAKDFEDAQNREREEFLMNTLRADAYKVNSIKESWYRFFKGGRELAFIYDVGKEDNPNYDKDVTAKSKTIATTFEGMEVAISMYKLAVKEVVEHYSNYDIEKYIERLKKDYNGDQNYHKVFRDNIDVFYKHLLLVQKNGIDVLSFDKIMSDLGRYKDPRSEKMVREFKKKKKLDKDFLLKLFPVTDV